MTTTESDIYTGDVGFDAVLVLSVLTKGYYESHVLAEECGLCGYRTRRALQLLIANRKASSHPLYGYALYGSPIRS
jgi:hypothetical protein